MAEVSATKKMTIAVKCLEMKLGNRHHGLMLHRGGERGNGLLGWLPRLQELQRLESGEWFCSTSSQQSHCGGVFFWLLRFPGQVVVIPSPSDQAQAPDQTL
jgi:hypothetical protein